MNPFIYFNDRIEEASKLMIPVTSAGLLYGWGVFTTLRINSGKPVAFDRHFERLVENTERARIAFTLTGGELKTALAQLIHANRVSMGRARITLLKGETGSWRLDRGPESDLLIFTSSENIRSPSEMAITLSPYRLNSTGPLAGVKLTNTLEHLIALEEARSRGFSEAVMLNERGEVVSATTANIFWVEGDELLTPALGTGCIPGVTRGLVHDIARKLRIHLVEGGFPIQRLLDAQEMFLTSTSWEIVRVDSFDIRRYEQKSGAITPRIIREFKKLITSGRIAG